MLVFSWRAYNLWVSYDQIALWIEDGEVRSHHHVFGNGFTIAEISEYIFVLKVRYGNNLHSLDLLH